MDEKELKVSAIELEIFRTEIGGLVWMRRS